LLEYVDFFRLSPHQVANFLWLDLVFSLPSDDLEAHSLSELSAEHLKALGELLLERAEEMGGNSHES
jgi:hypothetical protein